MKTDTLPEKQICQYLSFHLTPGLQAMLPTEQLGEILRLEPRQIVPIFDVPPAVMGVGNRRGEVLWIVDLACLLGLEPLFNQDCSHLYSIIVLQKQNQVVGLAVNQVGQLVLCKASQIQPSQAENIPLKLAFCLKGEKRSLYKKTLLVLDGEKLLELLSRQEN